MRRKLAFGVLGLATAATLLPLTSASAFCSAVYEELTGQCSPCNTIGPAYGNLDRRLGGALPALDCLD